MTTSSPITNLPAAAITCAPPAPRFASSVPWTSHVVREAFPVFQLQPDVILFDNASTSQKPKSVIDTITTYYEETCANVGRAAYAWSTQLSQRVEESRQAIAGLIGAQNEDVAFTSGATDSLNMVATAWGLLNLRDGDEVMVCLDDHQSAVLPWMNVQQMLNRYGVEIKIIPFAMHPSGTYDRKSIAQGIGSRTRVIALSHIHHLYGMEMDLPELRRIIPDGVLISLDATQSIGHAEVNVEQLGVHFVSFSGHKMFAGSGSGVLWVHPDLRRELWPARVGAKGAARVSDCIEFDYSTLSGLLEGGTPNIPSILSFIPAVSLIESLGVSNIETRVSELTHYLHAQLKSIPGLEFAPGLGVCKCTKGYGIIGFRIPGIDSADLADYLSAEQIFVRTGDHCLAAPGRKEDYARVSLHIYNTEDEIDRFVEVLTDATC